MSKVVHVGGIAVGDGHPTVLVAEIGTFFNQDLGEAEKLLRGIAAAGVPIFKTEILHDAEVCLKNSGLTHVYKHAHGEQTEDYRQLIERKVVPLSAYRDLFNLCREVKIPYIASVYDFQGVDFLRAEGAAAIKIARHNVTHFPLIRYAAATSLPLIFDTGQMYMHELARAVQVARAAGAKDIIVNHHPGSNPAPAENHHLNTLKTYKQAFDCPVGLSCHYRGEEILHVAIGCGVNLIEKGVVDNPDKVEQDIVSAANIADLKGLVQRLKSSWYALGADYPPIQEPRNLTVRKGLVAAGPIKQGAPIGLENVRFAWPPKGIKVEDWDLVVGKPAARDLQSGDIIDWKDIAFEP